MALLISAASLATKICWRVLNVKNGNFLMITGSLDEKWLLITSSFSHIAWWGGGWWRFWSNKSCFYDDMILKTKQNTVFYSRVINTELRYFVGITSCKRWHVNNCGFKYVGIPYVKYTVEFHVETHRKHVRIVDYID